MSFGVGIFLGVHVKFVVCNQTTMESSETRYDLGWRANVESVFGRNPWLWLLPVYGAGPVGDGACAPASADQLISCMRLVNVSSLLIGDILWQE